MNAAKINKNRSKTRIKLQSSLRNKHISDFSKVGGLDEHIRLLREIIVIPLLHADLYSHFGIKSPRGVLFYGPPGTGKTLVAGALANELSKEGYGKVQFYSRKGADVLDKWVGESEKKLRTLFEQAARHRPSIIFFDELDGIAPARSHKNEQVHLSIVTTLLALMDGLSNTPGVIVIGATNRLEAIDSALRRAGRFDRELYFPVPCTIARREILQVHLQTWTHQPNPEFVTYLADVTSGFTGSDLQALCSEAFLCCIKRLHPNIHNSTMQNRIHINKTCIKVEESDFITARLNITPWTHRNFNRVRKLSTCIKPLLQRQLHKILVKLFNVWSHFTIPGYKFSADVERYVGRLLLIGTNKQGMNIHLVPSLLQALEHLPVTVFDVSFLAEKTSSIYQNTPGILLLSRIKDLWDSFDDANRHALIAFLEDIHPSCPILLICTCDSAVPEALHHYFANTSSIVVLIKNPTLEERINFFKPLFFSDKILSIQKVLHNSQMEIAEIAKNLTCIQHKEKPGVNRLETAIPLAYRKGKKTGHAYKNKSFDDNSENSMNNINNHSLHNSELPLRCATSLSDTTLHSFHEVQGAGDLNIKKEASGLIHYVPKTRHVEQKYSDSSSYHRRNNNLNTIKTILSDLVSTADFNNSFQMCSLNTSGYSNNVCMQSNCSSISTNVNCISNDYSDSKYGLIRNLFNCVIEITSDNCTVSQLELLYDSISTCISMHKTDFVLLVQDVNRIIINFKSSRISSNWEDS